MENSLVLSLVAIGISIASLGIVVAGNSSLQSYLFNLDSRMAGQIQLAKSLNEQVNATQRDVMQLGQNESRMAESMSSLRNEVSLLQGRVASLEQKSGVQVPPPEQAATTKFTPLALQDDTGNYWTSWFVKESLYYPTLYSTSCDAPSVDCYVHFANISTPNGTGIEADTIGSTVYGYWFLGYSQEYVVPENGTITISGNFLKNDTFLQTYGLVPPQHSYPATLGSYPVAPSMRLGGPTQVPEGRSHIFVFILDRNPDVILAQKEAVTSSDNIDTWYHRSVSFQLTPGQVVRIGIGSENNWDYDYHVYIAWHGVLVAARPAWTPLQ